MSTNIDHAMLPPSALTGLPKKLVDDDGLFELFLLGLDVLASRSGESKSFHNVLIQFAKVFAKTAEFAWVKGFYDLRDVPRSTWELLREDLANGGWCKALCINARAAKRLSQVAWHPDLFLERGKTRGKVHLRAGFLAEVGTNIAGPELAVMRGILIQASDDPGIWRAGDVSLYNIPPYKKSSSVMLGRALSLIDILAQVRPDKAIKTLPGGSNYIYALRNGRAGARTRNMDPDTWGRVLVHAYRWVLEIGPQFYDFVSSLIDAQLDLAKTGNLLEMERKELTRVRAKLLRELPSRKSLESAVGLRITTYKLSEPVHGEISVLGLLTHLYAACFIILTSMNARRKDEIIGKAIGLHVHSLKKVDDIFNLYECEFYIEKTIRDYNSHYVNDISRSAIELMRRFSDIAWCLSDSATSCTSGRDRKLFVIPRFFIDGRRAIQWFTFDNGTAKNAISRFIQNSPQFTGSIPRITPHMFRRAYGLLYHFRYENAQLIALAQKYGHIDVVQALHYITDGMETEHGKTAVAKWARGSGNQSAELYRREEIFEIVREVGIEKLRDYIREVVESSRHFSGGFAKLVARFHRKLGASISYSTLDASKKAEVVADAFLDRGHDPTPYPWGTCMAGKSRKHSACSTGSGQISRENASPYTCGKCPYSDTTPGHLANLLEDEKALVSLSEGSESIQQKNAVVELSGLRRIIQLHSARLGISS
ncbi:hypothetical protein ACIGHN_27525 [Acidovorax sp. NPDC077693]|uniref:hypothetical protein n=1 Tax=unclassified Acidovorax TaxID=2684926 RepID=UPI0037CA8CBD